MKKLIALLALTLITGCVNNQIEVPEQDGSDIVTLVQWTF